MKTPEYITIKEAVERTGKHADTIRAFIKNHGVKTIKNPQGRVLVPVEALESVYSLNGEETENVAKTQAKKVEVRGAEEELIEVLRNELAEKNRQIEQQMKTIDDMQKTLTNLVNQQQQLSGVLMLNAQNEEEPKKRKFGLFKKK